MGILSSPWLDWFQEVVEPEFTRNQIRFTPSAKEVCLVVLKGQLQDGSVHDAQDLLRLLRQFTVSDLVSLYIIKYGQKDVNVNRACVGLETFTTSGYGFVRSANDDSSSPVHPGYACVRLRPISPSGSRVDFGADINTMEIISG